MYITFHSSRDGTNMLLHLLSMRCRFAVDIISRRLVWQTSLLMETVFTLASAGALGFPALCVFIALQFVGASGNCR